MLEILEDREVHRVDEIREELHLSEQRMARVSSSLLKTAMIEETGDDSKHHTYRITAWGLEYLRITRKG